MKMQIFSKFWMLIVVLSLLLASCKDDDEIKSEPAPDPVEEPSSVDKGTWKMDDAHMDKSYNPGDDFYMYCNGGFWNSTVPEDDLISVDLIMGEAAERINSIVGGLSFPSYSKMLADCNSDAAAIERQKEKLQSAIDRINAVTTKEEAWTVMAQLMKEGYSTPLELVLFSKSGKMVCSFDTDFDDDAQTEEYPEEASSPFKHRLSWLLANNPDVLSRVRPLSGISKNGLNSDDWPMFVTMAKELDIPLQSVYTLDDCPFLSDYVEQAIKMMRGIQDLDVEDMKEFVVDYLSRDADLFDADALAEIEEDEPLTTEDCISNYKQKYLNYESARVYAEACVTPEAKQRTKEFCEGLRETFRTRIQNNEWLSDASKQNAIDKLDAMVFNVGAPDTWIEEGFADLSVEETLFDDVRALRRADYNLCKKLIGSATKDVCFHFLIREVDLTDVNAMYVPNTNSINIFPAWMMPPMYDSQLNNAHNYAAMAVFGHEITHGFDVVGAKYNKIGDYEDIWASDADSQEFQRRSQKLIDFYSSIEVAPGVNNDGEFTAAENIADLGGFLIAYDTYVKYLKDNNFTGEQLKLQQQRFYQAFAYLWCCKYTDNYARLCTLGDDSIEDSKDEHSLARERINGVVCNTDDWYELFDIKESDKLYLSPENRIKIW